MKEGDCMPVLLNNTPGFNSAIDEEISKAQQLLDLLESLKSCEDSEMYLTAKDISKLMHCSEREAQNYMNRPDFPRLEVGKSVKVNKLAFLLYNLERRTK